MVEKWEENYFLLGPYFEKKASSEFEAIQDLDDSPAGRIVKRMREMGFGVHYGYWLVTGKPRVVLFDLDSIATQLDVIKFNLWERSRIPTVNVEPLVNQTLCFGELVRIFLKEYADDNAKREEIYAQFHEWMASSGLPDLKRENVKIRPTRRCWGVTWRKMSPVFTANFPFSTGNKKLRITASRHNARLNVRPH
jgi:glycogen synthase